MLYQVSMMGWVGSGHFCGLGWVQKFWVGLGFEKVTHDQLCGVYETVFVRLSSCMQCCDHGTSPLDRGQDRGSNPEDRGRVGWFVHC